MDKYLEFSSIQDSGDPVVYPVTSSDGSVKTASEVLPELIDFLKTLPEAPDNIVRTVITALSSFQGFGPNRNGDAFMEEHLLRPNSYRVNGDVVTVPMHESFEHFARPYRMHNNKPDSKAYGDVVKSFYNPTMRRVELVVNWDKELAPDICEKLLNYEPVKSSMGFRCMRGGDVCSICGNTASSRMNYCDHLRHDMMKIYRDGRIVCAINPWGKFFDISQVITPADHTSHIFSVTRILPKSEDLNDGMVELHVNAEAPRHDNYIHEFDGALRKAASEESDLPLSEMAKKMLLLEEVGKLELDEGSRAKLADIIKRFEANIELYPEDIEAIKQAYLNCVPKKYLDDLSKMSMDQATATALLAGLDLNLGELLYVGLREDDAKLASALRFGYKKDGVKDVLEKLAGEYGEPFTIDPENADHDWVISSMRNEDFRQASNRRDCWLEKVSAHYNPFIFHRDPIEEREREIQPIVQKDPGRHRLIKKIGWLVGLFLGAEYLSTNPFNLTNPGIASAGLVGSGIVGGAMLGNQTGNVVMDTPIASRRSAMREMDGIEFPAQHMGTFRSIVNGPIGIRPYVEKSAGLLSNAIENTDVIRLLAADYAKDIKPSRMTKIAKLSFNDDLLSLYDDTSRENLYYAIMAKR